MAASAKRLLELPDRFPPTADIQGRDGVASLIAQPSLSTAT